MPERPHIVVVGNIASGKRQLVQMLADEFGLQAILDDAPNPFLADQYAGMAAGAFRSQMRFMAVQLQQLRTISEAASGVVQERGFAETFLVFGKQLHLDQALSDDEFSVLADLYWSLQPLLRPPDLLVRLVAPADDLLALLHARGEQRISRRYLTEIEAREQAMWDNWVAGPRLETNRVPLSSVDEFAALAEAVADALDEQ